MSAFVLDASMTMAWHFRDERTEDTQAAAEMTDDHQVVVPHHWFAEVANAMLMGERRGRALPVDSARFVERLQLLDLDVDELGANQALDRLLPLARSHGLTVYDTYYLELAERRGLPLASIDKQLCAAARSVGVAILTETP